MKLNVVDPQNDQRLIEYISIRSISMARLPFNFYSLLQYGIMLNNLIPVPEVMSLLKQSRYGDADTYLFDKEYANQLISHTPSFIDLMNLLSNIEHQDEIILISNYSNRMIMPILDSLLKLIQERYGIDSYLINTLDDIDQFSVSEFASPMQYNVFVSDIQRYYKLIKQQIPIASEAELEEDLQALRDSSTEYYGGLYGII